MRYAIPFTVVSLAIVSCIGGAPTDPAGISGAARSSQTAPQSTMAVPLSGQCDAVMAQPIFVSPGVIRQIDSGTCELAHLGKTAFFSNKLINITTATQTTQLSLTAANGDSLYAVGSGTNVPAGPGLIAFVTTLTFEGGTGRFKNAAGEATVEGQANLIARTSTLTVAGSISYDAADRRDP